MRTDLPPRHRAALVALALPLAALTAIAPARGSDGAPRSPPSGATNAGPAPATPAAAPSHAEAAPHATAPSHAEAVAWTISLGLPALAPAGAPALARILLTARAGHHVNLEYPASFRPDSGATVGFPGARVPLTASEKVQCAGRTAETCQATLALPFTPGAPPARLSGTVSFSVCTADRCLIERVALAATWP